MTSSDALQTLTRNVGQIAERVRHLETVERVSSTPVLTALPLRLPFDGPVPFNLSYRVATTGQLGQVPLLSSRAVTGISPGKALATTYYVDSVAGSDAAAGTSPAGPWQHLAMIATVTLHPGDTVRLARGGSWSEQIHITFSGTAADYLLIGPYGSGDAPKLTAVSTCAPPHPVALVSVWAAGTGYSVGNVLTLTGGGDGNATITVAAVDGSGGVTAVTITVAGTNYVRADNLATTGGGGAGCTISVSVSGEGHEDYCITLDGDYIILDGCTLWYNYDPLTESHTHVAGVDTAETAAHHVIRNCEFSQLGLGIQQEGADLLIEDSYFHDLHLVLSMGHPADYGAQAVVAMADDCEIRYCRFWHCWDVERLWSWDGSCMEVYARNGHADRFHCHHNLAQNCGTVHEMGGDPADGLEYCRYASIHHNWYESFYGPIHVNTPPTTYAIIVEHMTFDHNAVSYVWQPGQPVNYETVINFTDSALVGDALSIRNNVLYGWWQFARVMPNTLVHGFVHEYNYYDTTGGLGRAWENWSSLDATETKGDARLAGAFGGNLRLLPDSPAIAAGEALAYHLDHDDGTMPLATPDEGAFQLGARLPEPVGWAEDGQKGVQLGEATTNLITNPSAETGLAGWVNVLNTGGCTAAVTQDATWTKHGLKSVRLTHTHVAGGTSEVTCGVASAAAAVGEAFTGSVYWLVNSAVAGASMVLVLQFRDAGAALLSETTTTMTPTVDANGRAIVTGTAPAGTATVTLRVRFSGAASVLLVDAAQLEKLAYATPFCCGDLGWGHWWTGAANASTSVRIPLSLSYDTSDLTTIFQQGSFSCWYYHYGVGAPNRHIMSLYCEPGNLLSVLASGPTGAAPFARWYSAGVLGTAVSAVTPAVGWNHLAITWKSGGNLKLYLNQALVATVAYTAPVGTPDRLWVSNLGNLYHLNAPLRHLYLLSQEMTSPILSSMMSGAAATEDPLALDLPSTTGSGVKVDANGLRVLNGAGVPVLEADVDGSAAFGNQQGQYIEADASTGHLYHHGGVEVKDALYGVRLPNQSWLAGEDPVTADTWVGMWEVDENARIKAGAAVHIPNRGFVGAAYVAPLAVGNWRLEGYLEAPRHGELLPSQYDGLLHLDFQKCTRITRVSDAAVKTYVLGSRGDKVRVDGALEFAPGRWPNRRGLVVSPAINNGVHNPIFWTDLSEWTYTALKATVSNETAVLAGKYSCKLVADAGANSYLRSNTYSVSNGQTVTASAYVFRQAGVNATIKVRDNATGFTLNGTGLIRAVARNAAGTGYTIGDVLTISGGAANATVTVNDVDPDNGAVTQLTLTARGTGYVPATAAATSYGGLGVNCTVDVLSVLGVLEKFGQWERVWATWTNATGGAVNVELQIDNPAWDGVSAIWIDGCQLEKLAAPSPCAVGNMGQGFSWGGAAHASDTARTETDVVLDELVGLLANRAALTFHFRVQMPFGLVDPMSDAYPRVFDVQSAGANRLSLYCNRTAQAWEFEVNGEYGASGLAANFEPGEWVDLVLAVTFKVGASNGVANLYCNGRLEGTLVVTTTAPTSFLRWRLGSDADVAAPWSRTGLVFGEMGIYAAAWTNSQAAYVHQSHRPIVDPLGSDQGGPLIVPISGVPPTGANLNPLWLDYGTPALYMIGTDGVPFMVGSGATPAAHVLATNVALGPLHTMSGAAAGQVLRASGATTALFAQLQYADLGGVPGSFPPAAHNVLSASHGDTTAAAAVRGDVITAQGASPVWARLAISVPAANVLNVLGIANAEAEPTWKSLFDATAPTTVAEGAAAAAGTSLLASHRDHTHGAPATWAATAHDIAGAHHTITGAALSVVGASSLNTLGLITPSYNPGTVAALLCTQSTGQLTLAIAMATKAYVGDTYVDPGANGLTVQGKLILGAYSTAANANSPLTTTLDGAPSTHRFSVYSDTGGHYPQIKLRHGRGTHASPTLTKDNDILGAIWFEGQYDGTWGHTYIGAGLWGRADGDWASGHAGTNVVMYTCAYAASSVTVRQTWYSSGGVSIGSTAVDPGVDGLHVQGALMHAGTTLGVLGTAPTTKQTVTGLKGGNAALGSLLSALAAYGLITDSSGA